MLKHFKILILIGLLQACCKPELRNQYELSEKQEEAVPYISNQKISFMTNNAYEFVLNTEVEKKFIIPYHESGCFYDEYENIRATLTSTLPELTISISSTALSEWENDISLYNLELQVNSKWFLPNCQMDSYTATDFADTTINNRLYENAMVFELCWDYTNKGDTSAIYFEKVVYTKENGIELITFTNNDYYELVK